VRPLEDLVANRAPGLLAFQHVVVARKPVVPRKLSLTIGMLTMDEERAIRPMIEEIRRVAPDASILCVDSSTKDQTRRRSPASSARACCVRCRRAATARRWSS
jgi:hypothetical protein